jgi:hypothetical protein
VRQAAGQVARQAHRVAHLCLGIATVALLGLAVLGWRLTQGPIELPFLARAIEDGANAPDGETVLRIGGAAIGWQGWQEGRLTPVDLRLSAVRILGRDGAVRAELPDAAVTLSIPWLLRGELAPRRLELRQPVLRLRRAEDGRFAVELGDAPPETPATPGAGPLDDLLAELMRPPAEDRPRGALETLSIAGARVTVEDAVLGTVWSLDGAWVELRRLPAGGVTGRGAATLRLGDARIPLRIAAEARGSPAEVAVQLSLPEIRPAALAGLAPAFTPLAGLDATARLELSGRLDADGALRKAQAGLTAGPGSLDLGGGRRIPIAGLEATLGWQPELLEMPHAVLRLDGPGTPVLTARAEARRQEGRWHAAGGLELDAAPLAGLGRWWPEGLGGGERGWILANITAGTARNGRWTAEAEAPADFSALQVTALSGTLDVADATVHWLRPIPPVENAQGQVSFSLSEVIVRVAGARQGGTAVQARDATLRFLFPDGAAPAAEMAIGLAGPVPDVLAVLQHPRLRLFERRPLPLTNPAGTLDGRLAIGFPLIDDLPVEQLRLRAQARLREVRLADVLLGRPLERGQFELAVDNDGLRANGTATLAEIPARLGVEMDFRGGPPSQVTMRETVQARPDARQLAALGLASEEVVRGPVGLDVRTERRRNGQGRVSVRAELREAVLALEPLGWGKPAGQNAGAEAVLRLAGEELEAVESFRAEAPSLLLRGSAAFGRGARLERVTINEGQIDASRFAGEARPPTGPNVAWGITLRGPVLDLRRVMAEDAPAAPSPGPPPAEPGPAIGLDGRFERVLLGDRRELSAVEARVLVDGRGVLREGRVAGRTGPNGPFEATITPQGNGRALRATAEDAGALLRSFDITRHLEGGRLSVAAAYAHDGPGAPLSGTAEMADFAVRNAPGFAKLLQAMTLYGLVEAMSGPGLGFSRLVAPFGLTPEALTLGEARAFSASLGLTAKGTLDRRRQRLNMEGTIVPAYFFNSLLGNIPIFGRLFSPEAGGGLFAATFRVQGPVDDPQVSVNPLAALTPGFLRGLFGIGQGTQPGAQPAAPPPNQQ